MQLESGKYQIEGTHHDYVKRQEYLSIGSERELNLSLLPAALVYGKVLTREGKPVSGAKIYATGGVGQRERDGVSVPGVADTDDKGEFVLQGLPSGAYSLRAVAKGYSTTEPVEVELGIAEALSGVEILVDEAHSVYGRVVEEEDRDKGIRGASIVAVNMRSQLFVSAFQVSDKDGHFELHGVLPGTYMILVNHDERLASFMDTNVTMVDKDVDDVIVSLKAAAVLRGRVSPPTVASIGLRVENPGFLNMKSAMVAQAVNAVSDEDGGFELKMVPQGEFLLTAKTTDGRKGETEVIINQSSQDGLLVTLIEGQSLSGTVVDQKGNPVTAVRVKIEAKKQSDRMMIRMSGPNQGGFPVNDNGEYFIRGLEQGTYVVSVHDSRGELPWAGDTKNTPREIEIRSRDTANKTLKVQRADGVITGTVLGVDGIPIVDAWVGARRAHPQIIRIGESKPAAIPNDGGNDSDGDGGSELMSPYEWGEKEEPVLTDESGRFTLRNLRGGRYQVVANGPSGSANAKQKNVGVGDDIELKLAELRSLRILVSQGGAAVSGFTAHLSGPMTRVREVTNASEYVFTRIERGQYKVSIFTDSGSGEATVEVEQAAEATISIELAEFCGITGKVVDVHTKDPVPNLMVLTSGVSAESDMEQGMNMFSGKGPKTDEQGRFTLNRLGCVEGMVFFLDSNTMTSGQPGASTGYRLSTGVEDLGTIYRLLKPNVPEGKEGDFGITAAYDEDTQVAVIGAITNGGPADRAGIKVGDTVGSIEGIEVAQLDSLLVHQLLNGSVQIGDTLTLRVLSKSGESKTHRLSALAKTAT